MRRDDLCLRDALAAAIAIERFLSGIDEQHFLRDEILQSAVLQKLTVIGEAASRISKPARDSAPDIEWTTIVGLRNIVVHQYFEISWETIWWTARRDIPELARRLGNLVQDIDEPS